MASPPFAESVKARLISHMNRDHQEDVVYMLQHFSQLPDAAIRDTVMTDISLSSLTVRAGQATYTVPLHPPMQSWDDRRQRLIDATVAARSALGVPLPEKGANDDTIHTDGVVVRTYTPPRPGDWIVFLAVAQYYVLYYLVSNGYAEAGTPIARILNGSFPYGADGFRSLVSAIFVPVVGTHLVEMAILDRTRLSRHGVRRGTVTWFLWLGSCFIEGYGTFKRFDAVVEGLRKKAA